ncbi:hypothetical protein R3I93_009988 [Phoxinus phoxinus]|uniref:Uncharacterized protein n=1 Tax=Phoxinus phoxinus TaxID=58324 RepID=A0AAN9CZ26_9TELE
MSLMKRAMEDPLTRWQRRCFWDTLDKPSSENESDEVWEPVIEQGHDSISSGEDPGMCPWKINIFFP